MLTRIGKYEVRSEIGEGGFGRVYLAHDPSVDRQVAIKILTSNPEPEMLVNFRAEAKTTGNLRHKNIVTIYDFGEHEGLPYLVMEYLEGQNLQYVLETRSEMSLLEKLQLLTQTAEGLHYAHEMGVVHRDVKPANIMVLPSGAVKIMDFGIAHLMNLASTTRRMKKNDLTGTARYMAPEQFTGARADIQTDVFAFGVVCYECVSGVHPFQGDGSRIMYRISTVKAEPLDEVCPGCPEALAAAVQRALAFDRDARYSSLEDILLDFQPILIDVRRKHAQSLMAEVQRHVDAEDQTKMRAALRQVLEFDPTNETARAMLEKIRTDERRLTLLRRTEEYLSQGAARMEARDYNGAVEKFESALNWDSSNEQARAGLEKARGLLDTARNCSRFLSSARQEAASGSAEKAFELLNLALACDPGNEPALAFLRELTVAVAIGKSQELRRKKDFDGAEVVLSHLQELSQDPAAIKELEAIRRDREADRLDKRQLEFETRLGVLQTERAAGNWTDALQIGEELKEKFAEYEGGLMELILEMREEQAAAKRAKAIQDASTEASARIEEGSFVLAIQALETALQLYPRERLLLNLRDEAHAKLRESELEEATRVGSSLMDKARDGGEWEEALEYLTSACAMYPEAEQLERMRVTVEVEISERNASIEWRDIQAQADTLVTSSPGEAVALLEGAAAKHGKRLEYASLLEVAKAAADLSQRISSIRGFIEEGNWRKAGASLEAAELIYPNRLDLDELGTEIASKQRLERIGASLARARATVEAGNVAGAKEILGRTVRVPEFAAEYVALEMEIERLETATRPRPCASCGTLNPPAARFCDSCGAKIVA